MPSNLLILVPLLAGYLFYRIFYYTRYEAQSQDGYRLLFQSAIVGLAFFALARIILAVFKPAHIGVSAWNWWRLNASHTEYSGTAAGSVLLAVLVAATLNVPDWEVWRRAFFRKRLRAALKRRSQRYLPIWRRSVFGFWYTHIAFWDADAMQELPARWKTKRRMALNWAVSRQKNQLLILLNEAALRRRQKTTDYQEAHQDMDREPAFMTLPIADVEVANFFDFSVYRRHFLRRQQGTADGLIQPPGAGI